MYRRHKIEATILFVLVVSFSFVLRVDYKSIAATAVSVMSIALAVLIGAASVILGSSFAAKLKSQQDEERKSNTRLGVLANYLRIAGVCGILTIVVSVLFLVNCDMVVLQSVCFINASAWHSIADSCGRVLSALSCGLFALDVFFIWLILVFLINSMSKSV